MCVRALCRGESWLSWRAKDAGDNDAYARLLGEAVSGSTVS